MATKTSPTASSKPSAKRATLASQQIALTAKKAAPAVGTKAPSKTATASATKALTKPAVKTPLATAVKAPRRAALVPAAAAPVAKTAPPGAARGVAKAAPAKSPAPARRATPTRTPKQRKELSSQGLVTGKHIVCFWKQNDLGLFGRRPDRWIALWEQDPKVEKVLVFETPLSPLALQEWLKRALALDPASGSEYRLLLDQALAKLQGHCDTAKTTYKTYLTPTDKPANNQDYLQWVLQQVKDQGIASPSVVLWPACFANVALVRAMKPQQVIADLVDDQRMFAANTQLVPTITAQYQMWLAESDVVVSDSPGLIAAFSEEFSRTDIGYLPSAALETPAATGKARKPRSGKSPKKRLIVGYAGNLREGLDTDALLKATADNQDKDFWFVGPTHGSDFYAKARAQPNCTFWGTLRQHEAQARVSQFDVVIDPVRHNAATERMSASSAASSTKTTVPLVALSALKRL
jgi:hypothetical protein